jgi:hypothetical protein
VLRIHTPLLQQALRDNIAVSRGKEVHRHALGSERLQCKQASVAKHEAAPCKHVSSGRSHRRHVKPSLRSDDLLAAAHILLEAAVVHVDSFKFGCQLLERLHGGGQQCGRGLEKLGRAEAARPILRPRRCQNALKV